MPRKPPGEAAIRLEAVLRWRVARHFLAAAKGADAVTVARRVCGVHAQLAASAVLATRLRAPVGPDAVDRALRHDRTLVKTWAARGTLHLLPAADLPAWVAALSPRQRDITSTGPHFDRVTAPEMADLLAALPSALGTDILTRQELTDRLVAQTGRANLRAALGQGWGAVLKPAAFKGLLCFGPPRGRNVTFVAPSAWLPGFSTVDGLTKDGAIEALALAYLDAYGPADVGEFCRWGGLGGPLARQVFTRLGDRLAYVDVDGRIGAIRREHLPELLDPPGETVVRLLPAFDPYVVGSLRLLDRLVAGDAGNVSQVSRPQGWISPVLIVNGRIFGTWSSEDHRITVTPFAPVPRAARGELRAATEELTSLHSSI